MVKDRKILSPAAFYVLSWTWGFLMSFIGALVIGSIKLYGIFAKKAFKLQKHGYCYYITVGKRWGGLELGMFFLVCESSRDATKYHEHGHGVQNCFWGLLFPFVISIPSAVRYWYREFKYNRKGIKPETSYDSIWFESDATLTGRKYRNHFKSLEKKV